MNNGIVWRREVEVVEIIRHFDNPDKIDRWDLITDKEWKVIQKEVSKCRDDFSYAAKNYFQISTKDGEDIPFRLWESQELILEKWYWLREKYPSKAQRLMILKARQLGCSTVIEGLIAWATIFFSNRNSMVVSHNDAHASYLYSIMLHIFDMLPWWMKPMVSSRKQDTGLYFANPNFEDRRFNPGNQSMVTVQSAMQTSGVGQGYKLNCVHLSEYADWDWDKFKEIVSGDMIHGLADNRNSFAFLESTGKGAGSPAEEMWVGQVELGEEGKWLPVFIPWFFEKTRILAPEKGWKPQQPELDMQEKAGRDWTRCDNLECSQYFESNFRKINRVDEKCPECSTGFLRSLSLSEDQLRFMQRERVNAEKEGLDSIKQLRQELASTATEAFQLSGIQVFPPDAQAFVDYCINNNPMIWGDIDYRGNLHWVKDPSNGKCGWEPCVQDHRWDLEHPLKIWELPITDCKYCIGADVAEGLQGKADFSVAFVNKVSPNGRAPDEQVAMWRSNSVDPIAFAGVINALGRLYNGALVAVEVNKFDSCEMQLRMKHLYPNNFIWKHYDSKNPLSNKLGWVTNLRTKPMLWQTAVRWLKARMWVVRCQEFANEMKRFQKDDYDDNRASAERNFHDDVVMSGMIALFCAHDMDYSEDADFIPVSVNNTRVITMDWTNKCDRCGKMWDTDEYPSRKCIKCGCLMIQSHRNSLEMDKGLNWDDLGKTVEQIQEELA
jgi:hypothetical protein